MEKVDILVPPDFKKSGIIKDRDQAWDDEDWIGTFNLWIIQRHPVPAIIYQFRSPNSSWAPEKLDLSAGGHYTAGETILEGMREVKEELGKEYDPKSLLYLGRKIHVGIDVKKRVRNNVVEIFMVEDDAPLDSYTLQESEVYALCVCPIAELIKVHTEPGYTFEVLGVKSTHEPLKIIVEKDSFPYNWDNYHFKMVLLADRFIKGEKNLLY